MHNSKEPAEINANQMYAKKQRKGYNAKKELG